MRSSRGHCERWHRGLLPGAKAQVVAVCRGLALSLTGRQCIPSHLDRETQRQGRLMPSPITLASDGGDSSGKRRAAPEGGGVV